MIGKTRAPKSWLLARSWVSGDVHNVVFVALLLTASCATQWNTTGHTTIGAQTVLVLESMPAADVFLRGNRVGTTPARVVADYQENAEIQTRRVSYFRTEPVKAILIGILSLGVTVPFNVLPSDHDSRVRSLGSYRGNELSLEFRRAGYIPLVRTIVLRGELELTVHASLEMDASGSQTKGGNGT